MTGWGPPPNEPARPQPAWATHSYWGVAEPPSQWVPPPRPRPRQLGRGIVIGVVVVVLYAAAGFVLFAPDSDSVEWDAQTAPLARFVEYERGLKFKHAVDIEYLSEAEWDDYVRSGPEPDDDAEEDLEDSVEFLRAVGLADGDVDLDEEYEDFASASFVGFYNFDDKKIRVRAEPGDELSIDSQVTLVHELAHALQDQHFDLTSIYDGTNTAQYIAIQALVEGDATNVDEAWIAAELTQAEQDEYYSDGAAAWEEVQTTVDIPVGIEFFESAPYALGPPFAYMLNELGGNALDEAFESLPESEEHIFDPVSYFDDDEPIEVDEPDEPDGADEIESGVFGALGFYAMLAERIDAHVALRAVDGWGGDSYVHYRADDVSCLRIQYVGDSDDDTAEMLAALEQWVTALPEATAKVARNDDGLALQTCDPGPDAELYTGKSLDALSLPVIRGYFTAYAVEGGYSPDEGRCVGDAVIAESTVEEIADPEHEKWSSEAFSNRVTQLYTDCAEDANASSASASPGTPASPLAHRATERSVP